MISKAKVKFIKSLQVKKYRNEEQSFIVEGAKGVMEVLDSDFKVTLVVGVGDFIQGNKKKLEKHGSEFLEITSKELDGLGSFQTNDAALAVVRMRENTPITVDQGEFALVLDDIRDPGNLGTIIRTADWFGIHKVIVSKESADLYNPKVISATMGSFSRVLVFYTDLLDFLRSQSLPVYGTFLRGQDVHGISFQSGLVVIGNETKGISPEVEKFVTQKITIPKFGGAESLNAATATAIILDNIRRPSRP